MLRWKEYLLFVLITASCAVGQNADTRPPKRQPHEIHKKLFNEYKTGQKLSDLVLSADASIRFNSAPPYNIGTGLLRPGGPDTLADLVCSADLVVVGKLLSQIADFTDDEQFVFTDLHIAIQEFLKAPSFGNMRAPAELVATRPGGAVITHGHRLTVQSSNFAELTLGGTYIFFLRYLPESSAYRAYGNGTLAIGANGQLHAMNPQTLWPAGVSIKADELKLKIQHASTDTNFCAYDRIETLY